MWKKKKERRKSYTFSGRVGESARVPAAIRRPQRGQEQSWVQGTCKRLMRDEKRWQLFCFLFCFSFFSYFWRTNCLGSIKTARSHTRECRHTHDTFTWDEIEREYVFETEFSPEEFQSIVFIFFVFLLSYSIVSLSCFRFQTKNYIEIKKDNQSIVHIYIRSQIHLIKEAYVGLKKKKNITQRPRTEEEEEKTLKIKNKKNQKLKEGETYHLTRTGLMYIISILRISVLPRKVVFPVGSSFQLFYVEVKSLKRPKKEKFFSCCWPDRTASGGK